MTKTYDLYGAREGAPDEFSEIVGSILGLSFVPRESLYLGDYCHAVGIDDEEFVIQPNYVSYPDEDDIIEERFPDYVVLLRVNATTRGDDLREQLRAVSSLDFLGRSPASS